MDKKEPPSSTNGNKRLHRSQQQLAKSDIGTTEPVLPQEGTAETQDNRVSNKKASGEIEGPEGPDPTRYGDWERNGRCIDF